MQGAGVERRGQTFEEQASEQPASGLTARKKFGRLAIQRAPSARRRRPADAVDVGCASAPAPGVEDGDDADLGTEPAWIGGERRHRLGGGFEQDRINDALF